MAISKITKAVKSIPSTTSTETAKTEVKVPEVKKVEVKEIAKAEVKVPEVKKVEVKETAKTEKVVKKDIDIPNLPAIKGITTTSKSSCTIFQNEKGVKWYLKGHTMEVTTAKGLESRTELLSNERLESGRMGKIIGMIRKVQDNTDLTSILTHLLLANPTAKKESEKAKAPITTAQPIATKAA